MDKTLSFKPGERVFLVGIGGISMRSLAVILNHIGCAVSGSDRDRSQVTDLLCNAGIPVFIGHDKKNIKGADAVIRTAAVHDDNPEISAARASGIPVYERAEAWGIIMRGYKRVVCFAGCHGKSTATGMMTHAALQAKLDPTVMIGAELKTIFDPVTHGTLRIGGHKMFIAEACEYCDSFLYFHPTVAVINNIEADHLDYFKTLDRVKESFRRWALLTSPEGSICANIDDENTRDALDELDRNILWFGLGAGAQITARNISYDRGFGRFTCVRPDGEIDISLNVPGEYNIHNSLAVAAACYASGISLPDFQDGIKSFRGVGRRFELTGKFNGAVVMDDYAHHPSEIRNLLESVRRMGYERIICIFQPHTYSRTATLYNKFISALSLSNITVLADIYAARETNTYGVTSEKLASDIPGAVYFPSFEEIAEYIKKTARPGDLVLTVGAGDVWKIGKMIIK